MMKSITVAVKAQFAWPTEETEIEYLGKKYLLRPETDKDVQSVSLICQSGMDMESARLSVNRFLSALAWAEENGIIELFAIGSSSPIPPKVGKSNAQFVTHKFRADYLPEPKGDKSLRSLALFREAQSINSPSYSFLGFFKILNVLFEKGKDQIAWINANLTDVKEHRAKKRLDELVKLHSDIGDYLYVQGRCAVAHAFADPVVDPDEPTELARLSEDLPLIKELASLAIESELGIISKSTYHGLHIYELEGFTEVIGDKVIESIKAGEQIPQGKVINCPPLSIRLRDHDPFATYENLIPISIQQHDKKLILRLHSEDNILQLYIVLDFGEWKLLFDPFDCVNIYDDGSSMPMLVRSDTALFAKGKYLNGQVEVYASDTNKLLARTDPFIPVNIDPGGTAKNMDEISRQALEEAKKRENKEA